MKKEKRRSSLGRGRISIGRGDLSASAVEGTHEFSILFSIATITACVVLKFLYILNHVTVYWICFRLLY